MAKTERLCFRNCVSLISVDLKYDEVDRPHKFTGHAKESRFSVTAYVSRVSC